MFARLRLAVARLFEGAPKAPSGEVTYLTVPVTVRALTTDRADMRLLIDVRVEGGGSLTDHDRERFVHAVTIPATRDWVERHDLAGLHTQLTPVLYEIRRTIQEPLAQMGPTLLDVELVAAEHLLSPPTTDPTDGSE